MRTIWLDWGIDLPPLERVRNYLHAHGWRLKDWPGQELLVFEGPLADDGQPIIQVVPASEAYQDYPHRVDELVRSLAVIEDRPIPAVLREMLGNADGLVEREQTKTNGTSPSPVSPESRKGP
jgi:hypothetical protein